VIKEPFNALLWHAAATMRACSVELAQHGSQLLRNLAPCLPGKLFGIGSITSTTDFTLVDFANYEHYKFNQAVNGEWRVEARQGPSTIEIHSIGECLRVINQEIYSLTYKFSDVQIDFNNWPDIEPSSDNSLQMLGIFDLRGLDKLVQLEALASRVSFTSTVTSPMSLGTMAATQDLVRQIDHLTRRARILLTNALIYSVYASAADKE